MLDSIKDFLVPISTSITLLSISIGAWIAIEQYRLKLKSETIESDIKLIKAFCDLLNIAHARGQVGYSEKLLEEFFKSNSDLETEVSKLTLDQKLEKALLIPKVGYAAQDAAIAAVATLGIRHNVLQDASIQALESLSIDIPNKKEIIAAHLARAKRGREYGLGT
jgi:hypothetical protein